MPYEMGIDVGSWRSKGVLLHEGKIIASYECSSGGDMAVIAEEVRDQLLSRAGLSRGDITSSVATGYGARQAAFADHVVSDISCHGRGIHSLLPAVRTVVDVGDLSSKAFRIDDRGNLIKFLLSGKCAGGSGRVLQVIAKVLHVGVEEIGSLAMTSTKRLEFNTGCVVFAESEAVSRVAEGVAKEDLLAAIHRALAAQLNSLIERLGIEKEVGLTGGGARDAGLVKAFEEITGLAVSAPENPHMTAALGAAILAGEKGHAGKG